MKQIYELHGQGLSKRAIARTLGISRNTVRKYLEAQEIPKQKPRAPQSSKLDSYKAYLKQRIEDGVLNCMVLLRELREQGYAGGYTILKDFVKPFRSGRKVPQVTVRFETRPGEQAQVDFGHFSYRTPDGHCRQVWAFVMVLSWSRAIYVEFVRRTDLATFLRCHLNAFSYFGGVPGSILYDNTKVVVLGRDAEERPIWNPGFLDFALRVGFTPQLCRPYRAQTKGRVESGVKYVRGNFWPGARFVDLDDLNRQARLWCEHVANQRIHGTTRQRPVDRLQTEQSHLLPLPEVRRVVPWLRENRKVGRDGFVQWDQAYYGVPWQWAGKEVQVQAEPDRIEIWAGDQRIAVHPRAMRPGQRFTLPGQWSGLPRQDDRPAKEALAVQIPRVEVQHRSLATYEQWLEGGSRP